MLPTLVYRAPRALSFELRIDIARYHRVLFEKRTPMCGMWHAMPAASDACARRVFMARWGLVLLSRVWSQGDPVGVVCDSEAVHVLCICI